MTIPDSDAIKYGFMTLVTIILGMVGWGSRRQVNRIDNLEKQVNHLNAITAPREAINKELDEIRAQINDSRQEFREEHRQTRKEVKGDIKDLQDLILKLIEKK